MSINHTSAQYRILRWPDVRQMVGLSRSQIYKLIQNEQFPEPVKLGARASGWIEAEVLVWVQERIEERSTRKPQDDAL